MEDLNAEGHNGFPRKFFDLYNLRNLVKGNLNIFKILFSDGYICYVDYII